MQPVTEAPTAEPQPSQPSVVAAFAVLVVHSFQRHWGVRQMGWVSVGLLAVVVTTVAIVTARNGWDLRERRAYRAGPTYHQFIEKEYLPQQVGYGVAVAGADYGMPAVLLVIQQRILTSEKLLNDWAFLNYTRWVMLGVFLGFLLPMFTLSYATAAFGTERESRSLVWLMTRPIPRSAIYLAKFIGTLPWCVAFGLGGFAAVCVAGGDLGKQALALYWPAAVAGTIAFAALFHLIGAIFRRPVVVGLVYVFFFEALVAALPGSLKLLSLSFYARSLMYNATSGAGYPTEMLDVPQAVSNATAWWFLGIATVGLTALGMGLFARLEHRDDV
jgi:ABC-type transport system involved in multi-copper enzyme maturation permease subunit